MFVAIWQGYRDRSDRPLATNGQYWLQVVCSCNLMSQKYLRGELWSEHHILPTLERLNKNNQHKSDHFSGAMSSSLG
jgi:hypothetical protein